MCFLNNVDTYGRELCPFIKVIAAVAGGETEILDHTFKMYYYVIVDLI